MIYWTKEIQIKLFIKTLNVFTGRCYILLDGQKCRKCDFKSTSSFYFSLHTRQAHHKKGITAKKVDESNFSIAGLQLNEIKNGTSSKKYLTKCRVCDKTFNRKDSLVLHLRTVHLKERRFKCDICQEGFTSNKDLSRHSGTISY